MLSGGSFEDDLVHAYECLGKMAALLFKNLKSYNYITYLVKENNGDITRVHVRVGNIIKVSEKQEEKTYT